MKEKKNAKEPSRHKPFIYEAEGSETAVLMVHGILGSPLQFEGVAKMLFKQGFTVMAVLLPGHGGSARDFSKAGGKEWRLKVHESAAFLRQRYKRVIIIGHSLGALLAINEAAENTAEGLILMAAPMIMKAGVGRIKMSLRVLWGDPKRDDDFIKTYRLAYSVQKGPVWGYILWLPRMAELLRLSRQTRRRLDMVKCPVLIIQSQRDETVSSRSVKILQRGLSAARPEVFLMEKSGHSYFHPDEIDSLYSTITRFVKEHSAQDRQSI